MGLEIEKKTRYYPQLDALKFFLSLLIVAIHTKLSDVLYPWLSLAVPVFFIISSFLFFSRVENGNSNIKLLKYIKRQLCLYAFYFVILIPITVYLNFSRYFNGFIGVVRFFEDLLLGTTYPDSWFIMASILGVVIVYAFSKINDYLPLAVGILLYCFCLICNSYSFLIDSGFISVIERLEFYPTNSFFIAIIYISLGRIIAKRVIDGKKINIFATCIAVIVFAVLLFFEYRIVFSHTVISHYSAYIFLVPLAYFVFELFITENPINKKIGKTDSKKWIFLRNSSVIIYGTHIPVTNVLHILGINYGITMFICVVVLSMAISISVLYSEKRGIKILKVTSKNSPPSCK